MGLNSYLIRNLREQFTIIMLENVLYLRRVCCRSAPFRKFGVLSRTEVIIIILTCFVFSVTCLSLLLFCPYFRCVHILEGEKHLALMWCVVELRSFLNYSFINVAVPVISQVPAVNVVVQIC
jgi:hypothetical protein